jgi:hypothetical protein
MQNHLKNHFQEPRSLRSPVFGPHLRLLYTFPFSWLAILVVAELFHRLVELPSLHLPNYLLEHFHLYVSKTPNQANLDIEHQRLNGAELLQAYGILSKGAATWYDRIPNADFCRFL